MTFSGLSQELGDFRKWVSNVPYHAEINTDIPSSKKFQQPAPRRAKFHLGKERGSLCSAISTPLLDIGECWRGPMMA